MRKGATAILATALLTAACSAEAPVARASATASRCIPLEQVVGRRAAGADGVVFEMLGGVVYRNRLRGRCPGLERLGSTATISVDSGGEGGRLCAGDRIRVVDPVEARATGLASYPSCVLGDFEVAAPA